MPSFTFTSSRSTLSLAVIALLSFSISACQQTSTDAPNSDTKNWSCESQDTPFAYDACHIQADALTSGDYSLQLFWQQPDSTQPLLTFDTLLTTLSANQTLSFATNAGMYNEKFAPIGYTVIEGEEKRALNLKEGGGNFHLLPNGVLWWDKAGNVQITESHAFDKRLKSDEAKPWYATQSGPMLVINDDIHPQFDPDSTSLKIRNGVGICSDGRIQFVNTKAPVTFYQFATLFKDELHCSNALFLDGGIASALYAPSIDEEDKKEMGVMIGVVAQND
ncbi:phosphodiester glycosidase family protein [Psychrobacter alimentarius]|uniref:phosphodiester glycosidase family protein n=1 Tax=Psychrobacter alimentarius TaxID=261164 RepID=UPI00191A0033|nr:phosphodiester glycosidase family protein [Psychrobacter alimentarius]